MVDNGADNDKMDQEESAPNQDSVTPIRDPLSLRNTDTGNLKRLIPGKAKKTIKLKPLTPGSAVAAAGESQDGAPAVPLAAPSIPKLDMASASSKQTIRLHSAIAPAGSTPPAPSPITAKSSAATIMIKPANSAEAAPMLDSTETIKTMKLPASSATDGSSLIPLAAKSAVLLKAVPPTPAEAAVIPPPPTEIDEPEAASPDVAIEPDRTAPAIKPITPKEVAPPEPVGDTPTVAVKTISVPDALKSKVGLSPVAAGIHKPTLTPTAAPGAPKPTLSPAATLSGAPKPTLTLKPQAPAPEAQAEEAPAEEAPKKIGLTLNLNRNKPAAPAPVPPPAPAEPAAAEAAAPEAAAAPQGGLALPRKPVAAPPPPAPGEEKKAGLSLKKAEGPSAMEAAIAAEEGNLVDDKQAKKKAKKAAAAAAAAGSDSASEPSITFVIMAFVATVTLVCSLYILTAQYFNQWHDKKIPVPGLKGIEEKPFFWKKNQPSYAPAAAAPAVRKAAPVKTAKAAAPEKKA